MSPHAASVAGGYGSQQQAHRHPTLVKWTGAGGGAGGGGWGWGAGGRYYFTWIF